MRAVAAPALQTALGAGLAWYIARDVLGHRGSFFAPIAAAVALSTSYAQRGRRSVQMVAGVLLGIGVAELAQPLLGNGAAALAVVVLVVLLLAVALGMGFVGEGMMFVNQAAASAILVLTLHTAGTGADRVTDALVGGAVALVIGVGLFPVDPLRLLWGAEANVLRSLREMLDGAAAHDGQAGDAAGHRRPARGQDISARLTALTQARDTARATVRIAPRRMSMRPLVEAEERRTARTYLLANAVLSVIRASEEEGDPAGQLAAGREQLAAAIDVLTRAPRPWPRATVEEVGEPMRRLAQRPSPDGARLSAGAGDAIARAAEDVLRLLAPVA